MQKGLLYISCETVGDTLNAANKICTQLSGIDVFQAHLDGGPSTIILEGAISELEQSLGLIPEVKCLLIKKSIEELKRLHLNLDLQPLEKKAVVLESKEFLSLVQVAQEVFSQNKKIFEFRWLRGLQRGFLICEYGLSVPIDSNCKSTELTNISEQILKFFNVQLQ